MIRTEKWKASKARSSRQTHDKQIKQKMLVAGLEGDRQLLQGTKQFRPIRRFIYISSHEHRGAKETGRWGT